jgi:hypothetical protein
VTATEGRVWFVWITSLGHGVDHAVTDEEVAASRAGRCGEYRSVCGAVFLPAAMESASGPACPRCVVFLRARVSTPDLHSRMTQRRRSSLLGGVLRPRRPRGRSSGVERGR